MQQHYRTISFEFAAIVAFAAALAFWMLGSMVAPFVFAAEAPEEATLVRVDPPQVDLRGADAGWQLLVEGESGGVVRDLTLSAAYASSDPQVAGVSAAGRVFAVSDGETDIRVLVEGHTARVHVTVREAGERLPFHFERDIVPLLSRFGCNASGCHGKAEGQNGFRLSVFGSDPAADLVSITQEGRGRRVFPASPEHSLLLKKAAGGVPHGGGVRIDPAGSEYRLLADWIAAGMPAGTPEAARVVGIEVAPRERRLAPGGTQQLRVVAVFSDGNRRDVTPHARFQTNHEGLAKVDDTGLVSAGDIPGEAAIMAGYASALDIFRGIVPQQGAYGPSRQASPGASFIDDLVEARLAKLNIVPAETCSDADFARRLYLDLLGRLPTADEARRFLANDDPRKRSQLIDALLQQPEYADYWALMWADLLRVDRGSLGHKGAYLYYRWIRESFAANKPLDAFARELLTAEGPLTEAPAAHFYKVVADPGDRASTLSQALLGMRIECARCHHHPFDRWSQEDYYGMQAFFTQPAFKPSARGESLVAEGDPATTHPRSGAPVFAHALGAPAAPEHPAGDRRRALADWMTRSSNDWFARNAANRLWAHFLGRGLVEPVDDVRLTNPPSNPELLAAIAGRLRAAQYDQHALIREICNSRAYQRSATPSAGNERDEQNYARALLKRLSAEVLLDALNDVTGVAERFESAPPGARAVQLWDSHAAHDFLKLFGRPVRATPCACERSASPSVAQVLHVLNSPALQQKLSHAGGRLRHWHAEYAASDEALLDEMYLTCYARFPSESERAAGLEFLRERDAAGDRLAAIEDLTWSLLNTTEFLFNH